jgi:hypothetical protein
VRFAITAYKLLCVSLALLSLFVDTGAG